MISKTRTNDMEERRTRAKMTEVERRRRDECDSCNVWGVGGEKFHLSMGVLTFNGIYNARKVGHRMGVHSPRHEARGLFNILPLSQTSTICCRMFSGIFVGVQSHKQGEKKYRGDVPSDTCWREEPEKTDSVGFDACHRVPPIYCHRSGANSRRLITGSVACRTNACNQPPMLSWLYIV